ncbi:MAG: transcriptional regulator [Microbacteriaceae bacterium]|jgi:hypothetical protein|nr:transcriptional regulator [Microbacteriaceae bacterium]
MAAESAASAYTTHQADTQRSIGFWLKLVDRLIDDRFANALTEYDLSRRQWELLNLLSPGPATLVRLNQELEPYYDPDGYETAATHLEELIERGWIDVAFEYYELTGEGASNHAALHRLVARNRSAGLEGVPDDEYRTTIIVLERIARNLGWED